MFRVVFYLILIALIAAGFSWLAERPGTLDIHWQGFRAETSVFTGVVVVCLSAALLIVAWNILRYVWYSPAELGRFLGRRRQQKGLDALSAGMIAIGSGDRSAASRNALLARRQLPNEPMTHLLRAQSAQLSGDKATARRIFEAMLSSPDTEQLGLRGLYLEAERVGEMDPAYQFADRAFKLNPSLEWSVDAVFAHQCHDRDWVKALETVVVAKRHGHIDPAAARRRRAVLLAAQAQEAEDHDPDRALMLALDAQQAAPDLVPAAVIAGRILASRGNTPKATRVVQKTWRLSPHPDLATVYAYARIGDSPQDRLKRVEQLAQSGPTSHEGPIAVAMAAIEAKDFDTARATLEPLIARPTQRVCTLMARIDGEQHGDRGRVREWLARAVNAPRDPAWTADGTISDKWVPTSPVTGEFDAFAWRVPIERVNKENVEQLARDLERDVDFEPSSKSLIDAVGAHDRDKDRAKSYPVIVSPPEIPKRAGKFASSESQPVTPLSGSQKNGRFDEVVEPDEIVVTSFPEVAHDESAISVTLPPPANPLDDPTFNTHDIDAPPLKSGSAPLNARVRSQRKDPVGPIAVTKSDETLTTPDEPKLLPETDVLVAPPLPDDPGLEDLPPDSEDEAAAKAPRYPKRPLP